MAINTTWRKTIGQPHSIMKITYERVVTIQVHRMYVRIVNTNQSQ
jgi:hypothetical protein